MKQWFMHLTWDETRDFLVMLDILYQLSQANWLDKQEHHREKGAVMESSMI